MKFRRRVSGAIGRVADAYIQALGGVPRAQHAREMQDAYASGFRDRGEDEPPSGEIKRFGYRVQTKGGLREYDIDPGQAQNVAWDIWQSNPLARRALQIKRDYILGRGLQFKAKAEAAQSVVDRFLRANRLQQRLSAFVLELYLFGEQCYPVFVRGSDGLVRLGYIDPAEIEEVVCHPENALEKWAVVVRQRVAARTWEKAENKRVYRLVREAESGELEGKLVTADQAEKAGLLEEWEFDLLKACGLEHYTGSCFYENVNATSNGNRGYSDLLQVADWLDVHDETLFACGEREQTATYFNCDVTLETADEEQVKARAATLNKNPPRKGQVNVHNSGEKWEFNYPDLKTTSSAEVAKALMTFCLGGLGLPQHWYGFGDETNRATAQAQGDPTWRTLQHDQDHVGDLYERMARFVVDQAKISGALDGALDSEIKIVMPEMTARDVVSIASALSQIETALLTAEQQGHIGREQAVELFAKVAGELGVEIDVQEVLAQAQQQQLDQGQAANDQALGLADAFANPGPVQQDIAPAPGVGVQGEAWREPRGRRSWYMCGATKPFYTEAEDHSYDAMVALFIPPNFTDGLVMPSGELQQDFHVTLAYLGQVTGPQPPQTLLDLLRNWAAMHTPLEGVISGVGRFSTGGDGKEPFYASFDCPILPAWRQSLAKALKQIEFEPDMTHGFTPHITLAYLPKGAPSPVGQIVPIDLTLATITLVWGNRHYDYPLTGPLVEADRQEWGSTADVGHWREGPVDASGHEHGKGGKFVKKGSGVGKKGNNLKGKATMSETSTLPANAEEALHHITNSLPEVEKRQRAIAAEYNKQIDSIMSMPNRDRHDEYRKQTERIELLKRMDAELAAINSPGAMAVRESLKNEHPATVPGRENFQDITPNDRRAVTAAMDVVSSYINPSVYPYSPVWFKRATNSGRSGLKGQVIELSQQSFLGGLFTSQVDTNSVLHEYGHFIEHNNPEVHELAKDFYQARTKRSQLEPLTKYDSGYNADETTRADDFFDPYMGKDYNGEETEILSVGIPAILNKTLDFATKDPLSFKFSYAVMKGDLDGARQVIQEAWAGGAHGKH